MARVLVTGGAGFLGAKLVAALRAQGDEVRLLDPRAEGPGALKGSVEDPLAAAEATRGVETVFHLAACADLWSPDPDVFDRVNHRGAGVMIEASKAAGVGTFVLCSSATTLVGEKTPRAEHAVDEASEIDPRECLGAYAGSKRRAELLAIGAATSEFKTVIVNPTEPIGPGDLALTPPTRMMLDFVNGRTPAYMHCIFNFVPADDLVQGMIAAVARGRTGARYLLGGDNIPMAGLLKYLREFTGCATPRLRIPYVAGLAVGAVETLALAPALGRPPKAPLAGVRLAGRRVRFSSAKAERELGWRAGPFAAALRDMLEWAADEGLIHTAG